ncbi:helix-turn-helix domain-containing protein [Actinomadura chokoriensis]|uniref:helix-turn-helix domain-containing protein n=1 Tax=Actinomadura chokoriensis TaxID=454156 RepID=UPI0031F7E99B
MIEDHFGGDAVAALLELAGRYGIAIAYLDRPWFTRHLGRALTADEWKRVGAELNDFCAVLDELCAEDLEVYADLVLHAAGVVRVTAPADLAAGIAWTDTTDTADAVVDALAISTEPTPGSESAPGAEHATPDAGGPLPIPPPSHGREEPVGPQHPAARPANGTIDPHQLALSPGADSGRQAPSTATTAERTPTGPQPEPQAGSYLPKPSPHRAEPAELEMSVEVLRERYSAGESVPSIARRMGLTPRQVYRWMRHERVNRRPPGGPAWDTFPIELQELREWYEAGETIRGLARELDVSPTTVKMRLAESGATLRSREAPGSQRLELPVPSPVLRQRYEAGESLYDLAEELAVAIGTIRHRLLEAGTKMRPVGGPARSQPPELPVPVEQVLQRVEAGEPLHSLARELGVPLNTLRGQLEAAAKYDPPPQPSHPNEEDRTLERHAR